MKHSGIILFFITVLMLIAGAVYYLSNRFAFFFPSVPFKAWLWGFIGTIVLFFSLSLFPLVMQNFAGKIGFVSGALLIAILLYLLLSVATTDLLSLLFKMPLVVRAVTSLAITVLLVLYGVISASVIKVKEISIPIDGLTNEIKAVHITDIHLGNIWGKKRLEKITNKIIALQPDLVFNTGDIFDSNIHFYNGINVLEPFQKLTVPHYFVYGNHDESVGVEEVIQHMKMSGVIVLQNEMVHFDELQIIGLNNMLRDENSFAMHAQPGAGTIKSLMEQLPIEENRPAIVLHHRPDGMEYLNAKKINLLLSGHTHGGQLFPITLLTKALFKYNKGLYRYKDLNIYVSAGAGTIGMPVRVGTVSEITFIKLVPKTEKQ